MTDFLQDIRYALRTFKRTAGLTIVIVASLAIGIGANTAVFSVVNALLLKPLPYPDPDRLTVLWLRSPGINIPQDWPSPGQFIDVKNENRSFSELSISQGRTGTLIGRAGETPFAEPQRVEALRTSSSLFHLLGAKALYGRLLLPDEDVPGKAPVVVLSNAFWKRAFNADPNIVGKRIVLNGFSNQRDSTPQFEVVGVLDADFLLNAEIMPTVASTQQMDLFLPLPLGADAVNRRGDENYNLMARLKPGVTMEQAHADVAAIAARIRDKDKRDRTFTIDVVPLVESVVGNVRRAVLVVMGSVTLVLLIACANVANLLLTRATARQKEIAVRVALGAGWQRLVRQLLTETALLGLMGGVAGLLVAALALGAIRAINPGNIPRLDAIGLDGRVLAFTFAVSILTGILFGLAPALRAARVDLNSTLKAGGRNTQGDGGLGGSRRRLRSLLVVGEMAISMVLLVGAGLLIRSFVRLQSVSPGFDPEGVVSMRLGASARQFENRDAAVAYCTDVRRPAGERPRRERARRGVRASVHVIRRLGPDQRRRMDARAGTGTAGRSTRRDDEVLQHDEDPAHCRTILHRCRYAAECGAGRHHRQQVRATLLAEGQCDRQACVVRSGDKAQDRRRRRHREAVWSRRRWADRRLPAVAECGLSGGENDRRPSHRCSGDGEEDARVGSVAHGVRRANDVRPHERLDGAATIRDDDAWCVCRVCAAARGRRHLRRDVTPRGAGLARHRHPHGARRRAAAAFS